MMPSLLAVDLGLKTGLALYGGDGRLQWYRSTNFGSRARLKRGVYGILSEIRDLAYLIGEGDRRLFEVWAKTAEKQGAATRLVQAKAWRARLLYAREQRSGSEAKQNADVLARKVIEWSGAPRPTSLRHDAAEAILVGLWGVLELEWLPELPTEMR
jgi:hypothetical protein